VADPSIPELFEKLRVLGLPAGDYAVFGSGPLAVRGLIHEVRDIDAVARGAAWERATRLGTVHEAPGGDQVVRLEGGAVEVFGGWLGWDIDAIIDGAEVIDGLPFARLEDVLAFKRSYGRPKDLEHARLIEKHLEHAPGLPLRRTPPSTRW
jgi:hypothetical protein